MSQQVLSGPVDAPARAGRGAAWAAVVGGSVAAVGALVSAGLTPTVPETRLSYPLEAGPFVATEVLWTLTHVAMLIGTVGLARSGLVGPSSAGRLGLRTAIAGMALVAAAELGFAFFPTASTEDAGPVVLDTLIGIASLVAAVGFLIVGVVTLRAGIWSGWGRWTPLLCGAVVPLALLPVLVLAADSPTAFLYPVALWSATFVLLGAAMLAQPGSAPTRGAGRTPGTPG